MNVLDLAPYLTVPGERVIARRVAGRRAHEAAVRAAVKNIQNDPLWRQA